MEHINLCLIAGDRLVNRNGNRFQHQGFIILMVCSAIMLGIGIVMHLYNVDSTSIVTGRYGGSAERTISWQMPIFGAVVLLIIGILIKIDRPSLPKMNVQEKRTFIFDKIADFLKENDFKKRGYHFFRSNGSVGYCVNIQNDKWNNAEGIQFTLNLGLFTDSFWLEHHDNKQSAVAPSFPKEYECAVREKIGSLLSTDEDRWYSITPDTDIMKLWTNIEHDLTDYVMPFFARYNTVSDIAPNQFIYRKGDK